MAEPGLRAVLRMRLRSRTSTRMKRRMHVAIRDIVATPIPVFRALSSESDDHGARHHLVRVSRDELVASSRLVADGPADVRSLLPSIFRRPLTPFPDPQSPFAQKIRALLALRSVSASSQALRADAEPCRRLPYKEVTVARVPPRPELRAIGVTYRRIPYAQPLLHPRYALKRLRVLVLDGVVYCDSYLIAQALEAAAPASDAHPSLFPPDQLGRRNVGLQKAMAQFWSDRAMFSLAVQMLPWDKVRVVLAHSSCPAE